MDNLKQTYERISCDLVQAGLADYLEPYAHVEEVDRLRELYRPRGAIRLLLIAESHVRRSEEYFRRKGVGFLYNRNYYTNWWHDLLLPAFGGSGRTTPKGREDYLKRMEDAGFWLLDVSIVALSRCNMANSNWRSRPFDKLQHELKQESWDGCVGPEVGRIFADQSEPPKVCLFTRVSDVVPAEFQKGATWIKFNVQGKNAAHYRKSDFEFGTDRFKQVARAAGLDTCLR